MTTISYIRSSNFDNQSCFIVQGKLDIMYAITEIHIMHRYLMGK